MSLKKTILRLKQVYISYWIIHTKKKINITFILESSRKIYSLQKKKFIFTSQEISRYTFDHFSALWNLSKKKKKKTRLECFFSFWKQDTIIEIRQCPSINNSTMAATRYLFHLQRINIHEADLSKSFRLTNPASFWWISNDRLSLLIILGVDGHAVLIPESVKSIDFSRKRESRSRIRSSLNRGFA